VTPFYAEQGGQVADTGTLRSPDGSAAVGVGTTQTYGGYVLHVGDVTAGSLRVGDAVACAVDRDRRDRVAANHTMTHVLNHALRDVLVGRECILDPDGKQIDQRGSLCDETKLRFDFSWAEPIRPEQLARIEEHVAGQIAGAIPVHSFVARLDAAQQISSLRAVFGERYPDPVRVVSISREPVPEILADPAAHGWLDYSIEFCGGTHLANTREAGAFVLLNEEGIAKGVRRITAVTKELAVRAHATADAFARKIAAADDMQGEPLQAEVKKLKTELNALSISAARKIAMRTALEVLTKKVVAWMKGAAAAKTAAVVEAAVAAAAAASGNKVACRHDFGFDGKVAKAVSTAYGKRVKDKALLLLTADAASDRFLVFAVSPKGVGVDCKKWVQHATEGTGAKGGGKKDAAQFNGTGAGLADGIVEKARTF